MNAFKEGFEKSRHSVCYNGDIFRRKDYDRLVKEYPDLDKIMMGRGIMMNPFLMEEIADGTSQKVSGKMSDARKADRLEKFHRLLCDGYKMKELWGFLIHSCPEEEKLMKKIRKAQHLAEYERVVSELFCRMREHE